jgi:hypothetical protein
MQCGGLELCGLSRLVMQDGMHEAGPHQTDTHV